MKRLWLAYLALAFVVLGLTLYHLRADQALRAALSAKANRQELDDVDWKMALSDQRQSGNLISPTVGKIQFLKRGFSIQLESVDYDQNGIALTGFVGNPTSLLVTNLTLVFTARKPLRLSKDAYLKQRHGMEASHFPGGDVIGSGQTKPIAALMSGTRAPFAVTIPNVKQSSDGLDLTVSFSGERYSYGFRD